MESSRARPRLDLLLAFVAFALFALAVYQRALRGAWIGDDWGYIVHNVYVRDLDAARLAALLDPFGDPALFTANWAPVHMLAIAASTAVFGNETLGWHVSNVLLHAGVCTLLAAVYLRAGVPRAGALVLAAVFLVHPANVEAVAWAFQQKTVLALGFALAALLALPRRPALSTLLLALGLLSKFSASFALPVAAAQAFARHAPRRTWVWLGVWTAVVLLAALPEFGAFDRLGHATVFNPWSGPLEQALSIVAFVGRYAWMAATGRGVSTNHEPEPTRSLADPWLWLGAALLVALAVRTLVTLRGRREEAAFWIWAAAAWLPISQLFPFLYPMADRYLYFILPGLLGGAWFAGVDALGALGRRWPVTHLRVETWIARFGLALGIAVVLAFSIPTSSRARVFSTELMFAFDASRHYPDGRAALLLRARRAAIEGDPAAATAALEKLADRGFEQFQMLRDDPALAALAGRPDFQAAERRMAENWIRVASARRRHVQQELRVLALAHVAAGDRAAALRAYERALEQGGPIDAVVRAELAALRRGEP